MIRRLADEGVKRVRVHPLADGRDVDPMSYDVYLVRLEKELDEFSGRGLDGKIASGGGRMRITMDRYQADWDMVRRGWETHVLGKGRGFPSAADAVATLRAESPGIVDQDLSPFVVVDNEGGPVGEIVDGDSVVFFNFRGDRAIEISRAFTESDFAEFERQRMPDVLYAGMMEYDGDLKIPPAYLVRPPAIDRTISEFLVNNDVRQLATAETQKFGHVTYFWNGNNSERFDSKLEEWIEIPSDDVPFDTLPEMKAREVCRVVLDALESGDFRFIRVNFANGDMVGHTGNLAAAVSAMEVVDDCVGRIVGKAEAEGGTVIVTADHGNLEMMLEMDKSTGQVKRDANGQPVRKTSHTLSPVPWVLAGKEANRFEYNPEATAPGLANLAATLLTLLGFLPPSDYLPSLIRLKEDR
jgi:2,3-bisphosphoglycerate-independent phosphoglycerate mutase